VLPCSRNKKIQLIPTYFFATPIKAFGNERKRPYEKEIPKGEWEKNDFGKSQKRGVSLFYRSAHESATNTI